MPDPAAKLLRFQVFHFMRKYNGYLLPKIKRIKISI
jgi:hypothetical protein